MSPKDNITNSQANEEIGHTNPTQIAHPDSPVRLTPVWKLSPEEGMNLLDALENFFEDMSLKMNDKGNMEEFSYFQGCSNTCSDLKFRLIDLEVR